MALQQMYPGMVNSPQTELADAIMNDATTIPLLDASKLPEAPNLATIGTGEDAETILYTGKTGNNLTGVTRGFQGNAKAWPAGTKVARNFTAYDYNALRENLLNYPFGIYRNAIINGNFDVWQRGTSFDATGYTADRWIVGFGAGGAGTVTRQSFTPGQTDVPGEPQYYMRISQTTPAASAHVVLGQRIEDVRTLAGQTVTLSFYARVGSGTKAIVTRAQQVFGSGGSAVAEAAEKIHTITTSWKRFTHTFTIPSISGKTIGEGSNIMIRFIEEGGNYTTFTIDFANIQLNLGDGALPYQPRHIAEELELCRRYCQVLGGGGASQGFGYGVSVTSSVAFIFIPLQPRGRIVPSVSASGSFSLNLPGSGNVSVTSLELHTGLSTPDMAVLQATTSGSLTTGQMVYLQADNDADARIILDMEV